MPGKTYAGSTKNNEIYFGTVFCYQNGLPMIKVSGEEKFVTLERYIEIGSEYTTKENPIETGKVEIFMVNGDEKYAVISINNKHQTRHVKISEMLK